MSSAASASPPAALDPASQLGLVALTVADLKRSIAFYTQGLGLALLEQRPGLAALGLAGRPLLLLHEQPGALPWPVDGATGLYHLALLVPTRADLGRWLRHFIGLGYPSPGQGDHYVSEAFYLRDPDGHGIEVYADRPRSTWSWTNGQVNLGTAPVDVRSLLKAADQAGQPWQGLPNGTTLGHIHLQVGDIRQAAGFYHGLIGFDIVAQLPSALFLSVGGYHHHLGLNTWHSDGAGLASPDTARLRFYTLALPTPAARTSLVDRLSASGLASHAVEDLIAIADPWRTTLLLHVGPLTDLAVALNLVARLA